MTPGFSFQNFFGEQLATPVIRGVAQIDIFGQPNVAVFIDGIYVSSRTGINFPYLDFERIEVVKGPQSALYGFNAFSGAINYVTQRPTDEMEVNGELTIGTDDRQRALISVAGPLGDTLSGRAAISFDGFGGTYKDNSELFDQNIGGHEYKTFNSSLFWTPSDSVDVQWNLYFSDDFIDPPAQDTIEANCEPKLNPPSQGKLQNYCGDLPSVGINDLGTVQGERGLSRDVRRTSLNINWTNDWGTITSLTGLSDTKEVDRASANPGSSDGTIYKYATTNELAPGAGLFQLGDFNSALLIWGVDESETKDFSQEFRYQSPLENRTRFTGGVFYYQVEEKDPNVTNDGVYSTTPLPGDFDAFCPCFEAFPGFGGFIPNPDAVPPQQSVGDAIFLPWFSAEPPQGEGRRRDSQETWAVFGAIDQDFGDRWVGRAEVRYNDDKLTIDTSRTGTPWIKESRDFDYWTGRISLDWQATDSSLVYTSVANGKKPGGLQDIDQNLDGDPDTPNETLINEFGPEQNTTYEIGYKGTFWDDRIYLDAAAYYTDWEDVVIRFVVDEIDGTPLPIPTGVQTNAGTAEVKGAEFSITSQLNDFWNLGFGLSYTDSKLTEGEISTFEDWPSFAPDGDMSGQTMLRQPEWQSNLNVTYAAPINATWGWYVRGDVMYQSKWFVGLPNQAIVPARTRANLRLGFDTDKYTIEFWGRNITDDDTVNSGYRDVYFNNTSQDASNFFFNELFPFRISKNHPDRRTYGVTLRGRF